MTTKAAHYLTQLDLARCDGEWDTVPEWVRKVRKHAPDRACLALTTQTEHAISIATKKQNAGARPPTAIPAKDLDASTIVPKLLEYIEAEATFPEDRFQAQVCIGWLHWVVGEYNLAAVRLPKTLDPEYTQIDSFDNVSEWSKVCALKAAYLRANCLLRADQRDDALATFEAALPPLTNTLSNQPVGPVGTTAGKQLRYWSELFLTEFCMNVSQAIENSEKGLDEPNCISGFRAWAKYWEGNHGQFLQGGYGFSGSVPRRRVWYDYYSALSSILEEDLPFPTGNAPVTNEPNAKSRLRVELKKVEAAYEALLLSETQFPKAEEEREEVESFVHVVMRNWTIMGGRSWRDHDLGQGGRESLSRGVLDILYRAATKTYHSTAILRHLFTVHLAVAEFDLAFKALSSYLEIVKKGKARVDKTGHIEPSLDSDGVFLETLSQCIIALCRYGDRVAAEKARHLGLELEHWVEKLTAPKPSPSEDDASSQGNGADPQTIHPKLPPTALALSWQAIGLSQAQWSRMTYDAAARTEIQTKAIQCLKKSLSPEFGCSTDTRSLFTLGLLLAERRELSAAIDVVKSALMGNKPPIQERGLHAGCYLHERLLIPMWHLLALLLSARQDYVMAARACEGALEQFKDPVILFGTSDLKSNFRSEHLNEAGEKPQHPPGLVDEMDDYERESILEVKMTQLALVELMEGPDIAVNASYELLSLFSRLFGQVDTPPTMKPPKSAMPLPPKSSTGTLRSLKGSFFGSRPGTERRGRRPSFRRSSIGDRMADVPERPMTTQAAMQSTPSIQITYDNGPPSEAGGRRLSFTGKRSESSRRGNSLRKRDTSKRRAASASGAPRKPVPTDGDGYLTNAEELEPHDFFTFSSKRQTSLPIRTLSHLSASRSGDMSPGAVSDVSTVSGQLPLTILPMIQFSKEHEKRSRTAILIKVWLMIAGFYRRAEMLDDCRGAIGEAQKYAQQLEKEVALETTGEVSIRNSGWAGRKSVEELHADCWAELGNLAVLKEQPYTARADFEAALTHFPDHPDAIVGLSNILLDVYSEKLLPPPAIPPLPNVAGGSNAPDSAISPTTSMSAATAAAGSEKSPSHAPPTSPFPIDPLGLGGGIQGSSASRAPLASPLSTRRDVMDMLNQYNLDNSSPDPDPASPTQPSSFLARGAGDLPPAYKAKSIPLVDRLAARDRACGLLGGLTKLGTGWNNAGVWFALARAHEESGMEGKAGEVLWWCVELEEGSGVRGWSEVGVGGYVL